MTTKPINVTGISIRDVPGLDEINVFWQDYEPGRGAITVTCWGNAWTCYFGGMSGLTIGEFVADADVEYLVSKLGHNQVLKSRKQDDAYLAKIIRAIKASLQGKEVAA